MLLDELLPLVRDRYGVGMGSLATTGWSIGGFGSLHLAEQHPRPFAAVAAVSPAISRSKAVGSRDAAATDVVAHADRLRAMAVRVDCGRSDSFAAATEQLVSVLDGHAQGGLSVGCHDLSFRHRVAGRQAAFLAGALAAAMTR